MTNNTLPELPPVDVVNDLPEIFYGNNASIKEVSAVVALTDHYDRTTIAHVTSKNGIITLTSATPPLLPGDPSKAQAKLADVFNDMAKTFGNHGQENIQSVTYEIQESDKKPSTK